VNKEDILIKAGIIGASGYTGIELLKILERHPDVEVIFLTSENSAGKKVSELYPLKSAFVFCQSKDAPMAEADVLFSCLPHSEGIEHTAAAFRQGKRIIDLSADYRLSDARAFAQWYGKAHTAPELLAEAVYGLPEIHRAAIRRSRLIANPGCYPTSILLGLYPLLKKGLLAPGPIIADSKSGVSGAGRKPSQKTHLVEAAENLSPYNLGRTHRHVSELTEQINRLGGDGEALIFSPHLLPVRRGMLSTLYAPIPREISVAELRSLYQETYQDEPFIWLLPEGEPATIAHTAGSNLCALSVDLPIPGAALICSSIDNLLKGASGQAVQNMNILFGLAEKSGLSDWSSR
jgi:N-acetyl-gamma-glutamyl-phosphate reductase